MKLYTDNNYLAKNKNLTVLLNETDFNHHTPDGIAFNPKCDNNIIVIAMWTIPGHVIVYHLQHNNIVANISKSKNVAAFSMLNDIDIDSECNVFFTELTIFGAPPAPNGFDGVYSVNIKNTLQCYYNNKSPSEQCDEKYVIDILDDTNFGPHGIKLSDDELELIVANFKWKQTLNADDFIPDPYSSGFTFNAIYWKKYKRDSVEESFNNDNSEIFFNVSEWKEKSDSDTVIINGKNIEIFPPFFSDGFCYDPFGNWWMTIGSQGQRTESRLVVIDENANVLGMIYGNNVTLSGHFSNCIVDDQGKFIYVSGGDYFNKGTGWIFRISLRFNTDTLQTQKKEL